MPASAIKATFSDFKHIKTRKVCQLVFEIPAEAAENALQMLGFPVAGSERWCGIALLNQPAIQQQPTSKGLAKQAALMCNSDDFCQWLGVPKEQAANKVRELCAVKSRAEFDTDPNAANRWHELLNEYETKWRYR